MTNGVRPVPGYLAEDYCRLADLIDVVSEKTDLADYPHASTVEQNVLVYDSARLREEFASTFRSVSSCYYTPVWACTRPSLMAARRAAWSRSIWSA